MDPADLHDARRLTTLSAMVDGLVSTISRPPRAAQPPSGHPTSCSASIARARGWSPPEHRVTLHIRWTLCHRVRLISGTDETASHPANKANKSGPCAHRTFGVVIAQSRTWPVRAGTSRGRDDARIYRRSPRSFGSRRPPRAGAANRRGAPCRASLPDAHRGASAEGRPESAHLRSAARRSAERDRDQWRGDHP